ncbi:hypothetical protein PFTANZ_01450, partial [Plasmodium falciparum Tanzania (2000708)]
MENKEENYKNYMEEIKKVSNIIQAKSIDCFESNSTIDENKIMNVNDICNIYMVDKTCERNNIYRKDIDKEYLHEENQKKKDKEKNLCVQKKGDIIESSISNTNDIIKCNNNSNEYNHNIGKDKK